jgi:hypothetical protein
MRKSRVATFALSVMLMFGVGLATSAEAAFAATPTSVPGKSKPAPPKPPKKCARWQFWC